MEQNNVTLVGPNISLDFILVYIGSVWYKQAFKRHCFHSHVITQKLVRSHTFVEINHEIISRVILVPSPDSRRAVVSCKRKCVQDVLVNRLVKLAQENSVVS